MNINNLNEPVFVIENGTTTINRPTENAAFQRIERFHGRSSKFSYEENMIKELDLLLVKRFHVPPDYTVFRISELLGLSVAHCEKKLEIISIKLEQIYT